MEKDSATPVPAEKRSKSRDGGSTDSGASMRFEHVDPESTEQDWKADGRTKTFNPLWSEEEKAYRSAISADQHTVSTTLRTLKAGPTYNQASTTERLKMEAKTKREVRRQRIKKRLHSSVKMRMWYRDKGVPVPEKLKALIKGEDYTPSWEPGEPEAEMKVVAEVEREDSDEEVEVEGEEVVEVEKKLVMVKSVTGRKRKRGPTEDEEDSRNDAKEDLEIVEDVKKRCSSEDDGGSIQDSARSSTSSVMLRSTSTTTHTRKMSIERCLTGESERRRKFCSGTGRQSRFQSKSSDGLEAEYSLSSWN